MSHTRDTSTTSRRLQGLGAALALSAFLAACDPPPPTGGAPLTRARVLGEVGLAPGQFNYPRAIAAVHAPGGPVLWTIDKSARVQRLDPKTGHADLVFETPEHAAGKPCGLTIAPLPDDPNTPALYIADTHYHRVLVYDLSHEPPMLAHTFGAYGSERGQFTYPTDVAVLLDDAGGVERLYVTEYGGHDRVTAFDAGLTPLFTFGRLGVMTDDAVDHDSVVFNRPQSIAVRRAAGDRPAELVVVDACNHRIGRFTLDGELIAWIAHASPSRELGSVNYPYGLVLLEDDTALVTEFGAGRVQRFDLDTGAPVAIYGAPGRGVGQLASPWAIDVLDGDAYVVDSGNNRILVFDAPADRAASATRHAQRGGARR